LLIWQNLRFRNICQVFLTGLPPTHELRIKSSIIQQFI